MNKKAEINTAVAVIMLILVMASAGFGSYFAITDDDSNEKEEDIKNLKSNCSSDFLMIGADYSGEGYYDGEIRLTYYSSNYYDLSALDRMGGLGMPLELPTNNINEDITFLFPEDLNGIDCPDFIKHDECFKLILNKDCDRFVLLDESEDKDVN